MGRLLGIVFGFCLLLYAVNALPGAWNRLRGDVGLRPLTAPKIVPSYTPPYTPVTFYVEDGRMKVSLSYEINLPGVGFEFSMSPRPVRKLLLVLGSRARQYEVTGRVRIALPDTLHGTSSIEWGDDTAVVTIPDPGDVRFPDE